MFVWRLLLSFLADKVSFSKLCDTVQPRAETKNTHVKVAPKGCAIKSDVKGHIFQQSHSSVCLRLLPLNCADHQIFWRTEGRLSREKPLKKSDGFPLIWTHENPLSPKNVCFVRNGWSPARLPPNLHKFVFELESRLVGKKFIKNTQHISAASQFKSGVQIGVVGFTHAIRILKCFHVLICLSFSSSEWSTE